VRPAPAAGQGSTSQPAGHEDSRGQAGQAGAGQAGGAGGAGGGGELPRSARVLIFLRNRGVYVVLLVLVLFFWSWAGHSFLTFPNARLIASVAATTAIFGAALGFCVLAGALDLSVPGTAALAGVACGRMLSAGWPAWLAVTAAVTAGVLAGLANGALTGSGLNPLAATIGTLTVLSGLAALLAHDVPVQLGTASSRLAWLGFSTPLGIPAPVLVTAAVYLLGWVFLSQTRPGTRMIAAGGNAEAARRAGINTARCKILGFTLSGGCAAIGGIIVAALISQASPAPDTTVLFNALTAVALSGMALSGGRGSLPRVAVGAVIIAVIANALIIRGISPDWATLSTGGLLICALSFERTAIRALASYAGTTTRQPPTPRTPRTPRTPGIPRIPRIPGRRTPTQAPQATGQHHV
jgi:ribose transport system permease protein